MKKYTEKELLEIFDDYFKINNKLPTIRTIRDQYGMSGDPFVRAFGSYENAKCVFFNEKCTQRTNVTTLVIPDCHVSPDQDLSRFEKLNRLILDKLPDNIIFMGDFITLESLSNWDLNKAGLMEGRRYQLDIESGKEALNIILKNVKATYKPKIIFLMGNHETRLDRYVESKPELKEHLNLVNDLKLKEFGIDEIIEYREYYSIEGTQFTHTPMNAANQALSGKFAIHRASEITQNSLVFAHTHRKEYVNFYRHGADDIVQVMMCGAFFDHTDSYAYGGLNSYWRGCMILNHWKTGRFDAEEFSLERLKILY